MMNTQSSLRIRKTLLFILPILLTFGCKQFKKPKACIEGPQEVKFGETATFTWCGDKADEIHWDADYGVSGDGESISITFNNSGRHTIWARGNNKRSDESQTSHYVTCNKPSYVWFRLQNYCLSGGQTIVNSPDIVNYKAYLYSTKSDWMTDIGNGNHLKCIDSVNCAFNSDFNDVGAYFKKSFTTGTVLFVSVEYRNPQDPSNSLSNWADAINSGASTSFVNISNKESQDNTGYVYLSTTTKKVLSGKWKLTKVITNGTGASPAACNQDDYIKFYSDKTWKYHTGSDDCGGTSTESSGTYGSLTQCFSSADEYISLTPVNGPFIGFTNGYFKNSYTKLTIQTQAGSNTIIFEFSLSN